MVNSIADKHVCLWREQEKKKKALRGETEAWTEGDTVPAVTLTAWQQWTFPVMPCWLLGLDTTIWIILILASPRDVMHHGAKGFLSSLVYIKHVASEIQCYAAFMLRCFHITTTRSLIQLCSLAFACALIAGANKDTTACRSTDFREIFKEFQTLIRSNYRNAKTGLHIVPD